MYTLNFLESEWEMIFYISCCICIMGKFGMIVEPVIFSAKSESLVPFHPFLLPFRKPVELCSWLHKELHFHLLEFAHPEDKLACNDLISECFTDLGYPEWQFHSSG